MRTARRLHERNTTGFDRHAPPVEFGSEYVNNRLAGSKGTAREVDVIHPGGSYQWDLAAHETEVRDPWFDRMDDLGHHVTAKGTGYPGASKHSRSSQLETLGLPTKVEKKR